MRRERSSLSGAGVEEGVGGVRGGRPQNWSSRNSSVRREVRLQQSWKAGGLCFWLLVRLTGGPVSSPLVMLTGGPASSPLEMLTGGPESSPLVMLTGGPESSPLGVSLMLTGGPEGSLVVCQSLLRSSSCEKVAGVILQDVSNCRIVPRMR